MDVIVIPLLKLLVTVIHLYSWAIIISVILSWLIMFNVINTHNRFVAISADFLYRITDPLLSLIRRILPNLGGLDLSPLILVLILYALQDVVERIMLKAIGFN